MIDGTERHWRAACLLACGLVAGVACVDGNSSGVLGRDGGASGIESGRGAGGAVPMDAALPGAGGAGASADAAAVATDAAPGTTDAAPGTTDAATGGTDAGSSDPNAGEWWAGARWRPVEWGPKTCSISVLEDPSVIEPLQWKPLALGAFTGETPVVPLGHYYTELADGTNWTSGLDESGQRVVAVRDGDNAPLFGFMPGCSFEIVRTRRGLCVFFLAQTEDPGALACGDLVEPDVLVAFERSRYLTADSNELVIVGQPDHAQAFVDLRGDSVISTLVPGLSGHGYGATAAHGSNVFAIYRRSDSVPARGVIYAWDGSTGYTEVRDPLPLGAVNVHTDGEQLIWTESELTMPFTSPGIYKAPLPVSPGALIPTLVRKLEYPPHPDDSALGAGYLARRGPLAVELIRIADGARWQVPLTAPWHHKGDHPFINERSLVFQLFDRNDTKQNWVTFRAKLSDVLALPSD